MTLIFLTLLIVPLVSPLHLAQSVDPPLKDLLTERELREYQRKPQYRDRIDLFREVFDRRVDLLQRYIQRDQLDETADLLQKISALSHYAGEQSSNAKKDKDLRSSEVKKLEIRLRKLIETINDLQTTVEHPLAGTVRMVGTPLQMSDTPLEVQGASPALSQHTDEILASMGYGPDEIASMREAGVIR